MSFRSSPPMSRAAKRGPRTSGPSPRNWRSTPVPRVIPIPWPLLYMRPRNEVLTRQGAVDAKGGPRTFGRGDDGELHVADDVSGHVHAGHVGGLVLHRRARRHRGRTGSPATRASFDWPRDGVSKNSASRARRFAVAEHHGRSRPRVPSSAGDALSIERDAIGFEQPRSSRRVSRARRRCTARCRPPRRSWRAPSRIRVAAAVDRQSCARASPTHRSKGTGTRCGRTARQCPGCAARCRTGRWR